MLRCRVPFLAAFCVILFSIPAFARPQQDAQDPAPDSQDVPTIGAPGSRFLVTLETRLSTKQDKVGKAFIARTLDSITIADGEVLPPGTAIRGHVSKVHPADVMDKARLWLTFDEIHTSRGWAPIAANLIDAPDAQKLRVLFDHEGAIEYAPVKREDEVLAALAAAMTGAAPGVAAKNSKDAATGAAEAAAEAFMATAGMGQEVTLEPNMKLQLALARPIRSRRA
ncbi:MAG: hypothetical protein WA823_00620 [Candidatus Acidiferrales bacterium]